MRYTITVQPLMFVFVAAALVAIAGGQEKFEQEDRR
jgi:hypothetical protein